MPNLEWRSDDGSTFVTVPTGVVDRIAGYVAEAYKSLPRRGAEAGGLLIGGVRIGPVTEIFITGFEPVACDYAFGPSFILSDATQADFRAAIARHPAAEILGYYRSHTRSGLGLESSDRELITRIFPGLSGLVLMIKPTSLSDLTGCYFFFQRGNLEMRRVGPQFPFTGSVPGGTPPPVRLEPEPEVNRPARSDPPKPTQGSLELAPPRQAEEPVAVERPESGKGRKSLQWEIGAAGLMIAAALALLWWQYRGNNPEEDTAARPAAVRVASLGLAVHPGEGGWRITWDPNSPTARNSPGGALHVTEVDSHERIPLNTQQIQAGAATYRPIGDDITFRLELAGPGDSIASETYRVLLKPAETAVVARPVVKQSAMAPATPPHAKPEEKPPAKPGAKPETPPGEGYVEPEVVNRVAPEVPEGIRPRITSPQPIDVRVSINSEGRVTSATPLQHGEGLTNYLAIRAAAAARQWTFTPARQGGKPVASSRTIHFVFEQ